MPLSPNITPANIIRAEVIPWESEEGQFGIAYTLSDGLDGAAFIGTREEAEATVRELLGEAPSTSTILPFPKDFAAS